MVVQERPVKTSSPDWNRLSEIASQQEGYFAATQAHSCGFSRALLSFHVKHGTLARVGVGRYRILYPGDVPMRRKLRPITVPEAAARHGLSIRAIHHMIEAQKLRRVGKMPNPGTSPVTIIDESELLEFLRCTT